MGHEAVGYIADIGSAVSTLAVGDYVIIPDTPAVGHLEMEPEMGAFYGGGAPNFMDGLQSEYARVPFADESLIPVPLTHNTTNSTIEQDYLTVSDIWATAWSAVEFSRFEPGDTVAVFGAGPVGLLAAYSAILRGAVRVYSIDHEPGRLARAASIGAIPINFVESDPTAEILARESGSFIRSIDCVGMEAVNSQLELAEGIVVQQMIAITRLDGGLGQVGVQMAQQDGPGAPRADTISPNISFPMTNFFTKGLSLHSGIVDPKPLAPMLVDLIDSGKAHPGFISSAVIGVEEAPEYYQRFDHHEEIKVFIRFP